MKALRHAITRDPETGKSPVIPGLGFNMCDFGARGGHDDRYYPIKDHLDACGTVACLGGWCYAILHPELADDQGVILVPSCRAYDGAGRKVLQEAGDWLGLTREEAHWLFQFDMDTSSQSLSKVPLERALAVLDRIIETGEIIRSCWKDAQLVLAG